MLALDTIVSGDVTDKDGNPGVALYVAPEWWLANRNAGRPITELESRVLDIELESLIPLAVHFAPSPN